MSWTIDEKREAAIRAAHCTELAREDSVVIERPGWWQIITPSTKSAVLNEIGYSQVSDHEAESTIDRVIASYRKHALPVKWFVGPWTEPSDFGDRLLARGFRTWDVRTMACDPGNAIEHDAEVEPVTEANLDRYNDAMVDGWSMAEDQRAPMRRTTLAAMRRSPRNAYFFLATVGGEPAGTTGLLLRGRYAYLVGAHVLDRFRGRGLYRALIEARLRFLRERGVTLAVTHAREATSAPMLEHFGFETLFRAKIYLLDP